MISAWFPRKNQFGNKPRHRWRTWDLGTRAFDEQNWSWFSSPRVFRTWSLIRRSPFGSLATWFFMCVCSGPNPAVGSSGTKRKQLKPRRLHIGQLEICAFFWACLASPIASNREKKKRYSKTQMHQIFQRWSAPEPRQPNDLVCR